MMFTMRITILVISVSSLIVSVELFAPVPQRQRCWRTMTTSTFSDQKEQFRHAAHAPFEQHPPPAATSSLFPQRRHHSMALPVPQQPQPTLDHPTPVEEPYVLSPLEKKSLMRLETLYSKALSIKCPFLRRRATDSLDALERATRMILIRDRSLDLIGPPIGLRCKGRTCIKSPGLSMAQLYQIIQRDWKVDTQKGYYITGRLNTTIYRDDCFFDGPDPDMPIKGLRKYLNVACQLFDQHESRSELLDLRIENEQPDDNDSNSNNNRQQVIVADWKMNGILRLPWRPRLPEWTGQTTYHFDEYGLVYRHAETWDMSVTHAFMKTLWPELAQRLWRTSDENDDDDDDTDDDNNNNIDDDSTALPLDDDQRQEEEECQLLA